MCPVRPHNDSSNRRSLAAGCHFRGGFTLIELVIVMVIVVVAAVIAAPKYADAMDRYRAESAARHVAQQFELAARRARASGQALTLTVSVSQNTLTWKTPDDRVFSHVDVSQSPFNAKITKTTHEGGGNLEINGFGVPCGQTSVVIRAGITKQKVILDADTVTTTIQTLDPLIP